MFKPIVSGTNPLSTDADQFRLGLTGQADVGALSLCPAQSTPTAATVAAGSSGALTGTYHYTTALITGFNQSDGSHVVNGFAPAETGLYVYEAYSNASGTTNVRKMNSLTGSQVWALTDVGNAWAIAVDVNGYVYIGYQNASGTKNVRKVNSSGTEVWSLTDVGNAYNIDVYNPQGYVAVAYNNASGKTTRILNSSGTEIFSDSAVATCMGVKFDYSGNLYAVYQNSVGTKNIRKFTWNGSTSSPSWSESWSDTIIGNARCVTVDLSGNVIVGYNNSSGKTVRKLSSSGTEICSNSDVAFCLSVSACPDGNIVVGYYGNRGISKINGTSGATIWNTTISNTLSTPYMSVAVDASNNILMCCNDLTYTIAKFNTNGTLLWSSYDVASGCGVAVDMSGGVTLSAKQGSLTSIPLGSTGTIGRAIYRTPANQFNLQYCGVIWDNTTTTYTDNLADASLGLPPAVSGTAIPSTAPATNTTGTSLNGITSSADFSIKTVTIDGWKCEYYTSGKAVCKKSISGLIPTGITVWSSPMYFFSSPSISLPTGFFNAAPTLIKVFPNSSLLFIFVGISASSSTAFTFYGSRPSNATDNISASFEIEGTWK